MRLFQCEIVNGSRHLMTPIGVLWRFFRLSKLFPASIYSAH
jgi:hypothetical protein